MSRIHLFEFSDQAWLPAVFRDLFTDYLSCLFSTFRVYESVVPLIKQVMDKSNTSQIIDLCSGASGAWLRLLGRFREKQIPVSVTLSDKYPNIASFERISEMTAGQIGYIDPPIDPTKSTIGREGIRTLFSSFHHFRPEQSRAIIRNAVEAGEAICVFEMTERRLSTILVTLLFGPLMLFCLTPFIRPLSVQRLFWTYVLPVVPLIYTWDGVISHLRTYSPAELSDLADSIQQNDYEWSIGRIGLSRSNLFAITYLLGYPKGRP